MRVNLTPAFVAKKAEPPLTCDRTIYWDTGLPGFGLMVTKSGHRSYCVQYRSGRHSRRMSLKNGLSLAAARREAKAIIGAVAKGGDPLGDKRKAAEAQGNSFRSIAEKYFQREGKQLRSMEQRRKVFERLIFPKLGSHEIADIRRSEIVSLLDKIEDERGARMAHVALKAVQHERRPSRGINADLHPRRAGGHGVRARPELRQLRQEPGVDGASRGSPANDQHHVTLRSQPARQDESRAHRVGPAL
jgi:hypothetical protein